MSVAKKYSRPILAQLFDLIGGLCFIIGGLIIVFAFGQKHDAAFGDGIQVRFTVRALVFWIAVQLALALAVLVIVLPFVEFSPGK